MIKLGIAPKLLDFSRQASGTIDSWFNQVTTRWNLQQKSAVPVVAEIPNNQWAIWKNTATGNVILYVNDNGTLKSIVAYTFPITVTGGFSLNFNVTAITNVTLPTTGTLATLAGVETFTNKTLTSPVLTTPVINGTSSGTGVATGNTANTLVQRDGSGNFTAGTITAALTGNASTATKLLTARNINGVAFDGTADITVTANTTNAATFNNGGAGDVSGTTFNGSAARTISYNTLGAPSTTGTGASGSWGISVTGSSASTTGNAATATKLATARNINTVAFDGTADITVTAAAGTLTGTTLNSTVVTSSLTTVGTIGTGTWQGTVVAGQFGGTGIANTGKTITLGGNLTTSGAFATTFTMTNTTTVTFPITGTLATLAGSETFTNKTLTTPIIAQISNTGTLTLPTVTDTLVARTTTDTLTNKSLTSPTLTGTPVTPTATFGTNTTQVASTAFVIAQTNGPAFSAYQTVAQAIAAATFTKINMQAEEFDTDNAFDTTTYKFQPAVAGYYYITLAVEVGASTTGIGTYIYKNGVILKSTFVVDNTGFVSALIFLNGSTDFLEPYVYFSVAQNTGAGASQTFFQGYFVRST